MRYYHLLAALLMTQICFSQIKWNVLKDSISLTPTLIEGSGTLNFRNFGISGTVYLDLIEKEIYFNDGSLTHKLDEKDVSALVLNNQYLPNLKLFSQENMDSLIKRHRMSLYNSLDLNEIKFISAKKNQYQVENNKIVLKGAKQKKGKLCQINNQSILVIDEEGDVQNFKNSDFTYLEFNGNRFFKTSELYNHLYQNYKSEKNKIERDWTARIKESKIESLIKTYGPFEKILPVSSTKKLIVWESSSQVYNINLSSRTASSGLSIGREKPYADIFYTGIPSFFQSFVTLDFGYKSTNITSSSSFTGYVSSPFFSASVS